jgi:hypothetical protein
VRVFGDGEEGNTPDVGEGARQINDKSSTEEWRAGEGCHLLLRLPVFLASIDGIQGGCEGSRFAIECGCSVKM